MEIEWGEGENSVGTVWGRTGQRGDTRDEWEWRKREKGRKREKERNR